MGECALRLLPRFSEVPNIPLPKSLPEKNPHDSLRYVMESGPAFSHSNPSRRDYHDCLTSVLDTSMGGPKRLFRFL
jgi:hypothetical protein